ncbi:MAG: type II toxin-antitoxin system RelE/ParE family toxin [Actinomycetota bacterium]|nr:type II toxin-antitoxin system RelE/ParE family toxin [Actinomycetota bacterium]
MEAYELRVAASAERALARLPEAAAAAIVEFLTGPLLANPTRVGKPLKLELEGYRAARRGAYRIVYRIEDTCVVRVVRIDHRADVYRRR